jgi:hypothetical protein
MKTRLALLSATTAALLMTTAVAYADNNKLYLIQTGDTQTATITQSGGSGNSVGTSTSAYQQVNGGGTGGNKLVVNQNSISNYWSTSPLSELTGATMPNTTNHHGHLPLLSDYIGVGYGWGGNSVTGYQSGTNNNAEIDQGGKYSSVNLVQVGNNNGRVAPNWFNSTFGNLILQDWTAYQSSVSLTQVSAASGNTFSIGQGGYGNSLTANQTGANSLWVRQGTGAPDLWTWPMANSDFFNPDGTTSYGPGNLSNSSITVTQNMRTEQNPAYANYVAVGQGGGGANTITIGQYGGKNVADADQLGSGNTFDSKQYSADNNSGQNFVGGEAGWPTGDPSPLHLLATFQGDYRPITQLGDNNKYYSVQSGSNLWAFGEQIGNGNFLQNTQSGDTQKLFSIQLGDANEIYSVQAGGNNLTLVSQVGSSNVSISTQNGSFNTATISQ